MKKFFLITALSVLGAYLYAQNTKKEEIEIQEVVVTATRTTRKLKDVPITTSVISSKTIEKSNFVNFKDFLEQEITGLNFENHANTANINMMGLGAKYVLFLIDGERMAGETLDNVDYNRINISNIERIEIVKGAASSLYGSNAIGGVINIITKKPKRGLDANISARYGSFNETNGNVFVGTQQEWGMASISASYKSKDPYLLKDKAPVSYIYDDGRVVQNSLGQTIIAGYFDYGVNPKASINITPKIRLDLSSSYYFKERNTGDTEAKRVRAQYTDFSNAGKLNVQLSENKNLSISASYGIYEKFDRYLLLKSKEKNYENTIWRASAIYDQKIGKKHSLILGGEFLSEELLSFMFSSADGKKDAQTYSIFTQQEWEIVPKFTLVTGGRYDYHSEFNGHLTLRLSGMYRWNDNITLRGGYAGGFRSPTLKELYTDWYHPYGGGFHISGNTGLKVEKSHNFNLSSDINLKKLNITFVGQYSYIKDKITTQWQEQSRDTLRYVNLENAKIISTEISASYRMLKDNLFLKGGYSFSHDFNQKQQQIRPHTITARAEYTPNFIGKYAPTISFSGKYFSGLDIYTTDFESKEYRVHYNPYSIWRLGLNFNLPLSLQMSAGIDNIFDYQPKSAGFYTSTSPGRTYFVGLKWSAK